jgi:hypothetical protein
MHELDIELWMRRDHALDLVNRVVAAVTFDEDDLEVIAESRESINCRSDVPRFVAARDHNGRRLLSESRLSSRPCNHVAPKREVPNAGQGSDEAVRERANAADVSREDLPALDADDLEVGQRHDPGEILAGEPVLLCLRHLLPDLSGCVQQGAPEPGVVRDHDASLTVAQGVQVEQGFLAVLERADRVGEEYDVERTVEGVEHVRILDITHVELEFRIPSTSLFDHRGAEVDADAASWAQGREDTTGSATEIEDLPIGAYEESQIAFVLGVVKAVSLDPFVSFGSKALGELANRVLPP